MLIWVNGVTSEERTLGSWRLCGRQSGGCKGPTAVLLPGPAAAADNLNSDFEDLCKPLRELNTEFGASSGPGSPLGTYMQKELSLSAAQYGALWSLLKLTPTPSCSRMY